MKAVKHNKVSWTGNNRKIFTIVRTEWPKSSCPRNPRTGETMVVRAWSCTGSVVWDGNTATPKSWLARSELAVPFIFFKSPDSISHWQPKAKGKGSKVSIVHKDEHLRAHGGRRVKSTYGRIN